MTEEFEIDALHYLLDEMDAGQRAAFEEQLARDPAARTALQMCAESVSRFACDAAPAEPMSAIDQRATLAAILTATKETVPAAAHAPVSNVIPWSRYLWPIAAAVLVGLNFVDFNRPIDPVAFDAPGAQRDEPVAGAETQSSDGNEAESGAVADADDDVPLETPGLLAKSDAPQNTKVRNAQRAGSDPAETLRELDRLRGAYADLVRSNATLRADYESVMHHIAQRAMTERGVGRLAAMELVDSATYATGNRRGLVDLARGILTEPGVVAVELPAQPGPADTPPEIGPSLQPTQPERPAVPPPVAYAWSVFDESENRGYLNLYNLPQVPTDGSLQLWVRAPATNTFQQVGEVPAQFHGGDGSLFYTLPEASPAPVEILVTQEARGAPPPAPTGAVVLRGP
jgi:anti-sigma-K factor RskA